MRHRIESSRAVGLVGVLGLAISALAPSAANANLLYQTGFEPPTFVAGQPVDGQGGFVAEFGRDAGIISTVNPRTGLQSLRVNGGLLEVADGFLAGSYSPVINYDAIANGTPIIDIRVDVRLDGPDTGDDPSGTGENDLFSANLAPRSASTTFPESDLGGDLIISSNGNAYVVDSNFNYLFQTPINLGQDYTLGARVDFQRRVTGFFLDDQFLGELTFDPASTSNVLGRARLDVIALDDPSFDPSPYLASFDNYSISAVPEPSSLVLAGTGALCLLGYGWRRREAARASH